MTKQNISKQCKIHIKTGDIVQIICGKNKGKIGSVIKILSKKGKIIVKDINLVTKHVKPKRKGETGKIIEIEAPIHNSNVKLHNTQ